MEMIPESNSHDFLLKCGHTQAVLFWKTLNTDKITVQHINYNMYHYETSSLCASVTGYAPKVTQCAYAHALKHNLRKINGGGNELFTLF